MDAKPAVHVLAWARVPGPADGSTVPATPSRPDASAVQGDPPAAADPPDGASPALQLALRAADAVLRRAGLAGGKADPAFGVVVACNTSELDSVCGATAEPHRGRPATTPSTQRRTHAGHALAPAIANRFGLRGLGALVCSGSNASFDAIVTASNAIRNGRAERMLVVAVEADGPVLRCLLGRAGDAASLVEGAWAVVLEGPASLRARRAVGRARLGEYAFVHAEDSATQPLRDLLERHAAKPVYRGAPGSFPVPVPAGRDVIDLGPAVHRGFGAATLLQLVHHLEQGGGGAVIVGGGAWRDRRAGVLVVEPNEPLPSPLAPFHP